MPRGHAVIDIAADPLAASAVRRRAVLRIGLPILGVVAMIAVILFIAIRANKANTRDALALADDVLEALNDRISLEVTHYFNVPARAVGEAERLAAREVPGQTRRAIIEKFTISALEQIPQATGFLFADGESDFVMTRRNADGGIDTKLSASISGTGQVSWIRRNRAGEVTGSEPDPSDTYDPHTRPWYLGALSTTGVFWTDVYMFFTGDTPGITGAMQYGTAEGGKFVVGVDIAVASLSEFLASLKIGHSGRAMIVGRDGRLIAHPHVLPGAQAAHAAEDAVSPRIIDIDDAAAATAYDRFRVKGRGQTAFDIDGQRYLAAITPLAEVGRGWSVLIVLPEEEFVGFVTRNNRTALLMSLAIVAIAGLMAVLLIQQGLRADRTARLLRQRSRAMARQGEALDLIAAEADLFDADRPEQSQMLTETAAEITSARRASLWYVQPHRNALCCMDSFDAENASHLGGWELRRAEMPHFFDEVATGTAILTADAAHDTRTAEIYRLLMAPFGSRSLATIPMRHGGKVVGAIGLEDAGALDEARHFLRMLAGLAAARWVEDDVGVLEPNTAIGSRPAEPATVHSTSASLLRRRPDRVAAGDATYPEVAVLVTRIDEAAINADSGAVAPDLVDAIAREMQKVAEQQDIPYLKLVGCDIIGAAGFSPDDDTGSIRIANAAVAGRDYLAALFRSRGIEPNFRLGIDCSAAVGCVVGIDPTLFNLWGGSVQTAQLMAATALPGTIQTSEAAWLRLQRAFLLRPRGTYYLPACGIAKTFVLAAPL